MEYIEGVPLEKYVKANKFCTTDVLNWLKDICKSLKLMYSKNFLHRSVGVSNVMIREDGSAVLIDYERSYYKDRFENLLKKCGRLRNDSDVDSFYYYDYYDLNLLYYSFIDMLIEDKCYNKNYKCDNEDLEWALFDLGVSNSLEDFLKKVDDLCVKYMK